MTIELSRKDGEIICSVPGQADATLEMYALGLMFASPKQIKKVFGESKPEWKINFVPTKEEKEDINDTKAIVDKAYSK